MIKLIDKLLTAPLNNNLCYSSGAIWITRKKIKACPLELVLNNKITEKERKKGQVVIPYKNPILLLNYFASMDMESISFLWNERIYVCSNIDSAYDFVINPQINNK